MAIIFTELHTHCAALAQNQVPSASPVLAFEYADFALLERSRDDDDVALSWWAAQLQGAPELVALPLDRPRPNVQQTTGEHVDVRLDVALIARLTSLCARTGVTLNSALLSVWAFILLQLSGQVEVIVGLPHSLR
eukprot:3765618-Prymnesium_polylepis.2